MSTKNFVPRADGEGSIGTAAKNWAGGFFKQLNVANVTVDDSKTPTTDTTDLTTLLSNLANEIKQNKGTDDWKTAPATNLATLASLVGNLASGSDVAWEGNKFTNSKLGITGLMDTNGYICFGKNFGSLILQWIHDTQDSNDVVNSYSASLPISMTVFGIAIASTGDDHTVFQRADNDKIYVCTHVSLHSEPAYYQKRPFWAILIGKA